MHLRDLFGQLASDVALDLASDQWDFDLHCRSEAQPRTVAYRRKQCLPKSRSEIPGYGEVDLPP